MKANITQNRFSIISNEKTCMALASRTNSCQQIVGRRGETYIYI